MTSLLKGHEDFIVYHIRSKIDSSYKDKLKVIITEWETEEND